MEAQCDHERLEVYRLAREFNRGVHGLTSKIPRGNAESVDNLLRAAKSMTRNIAEGAGKWLVRDKIKHYNIARGSSTEASASLDEMVDYEMVSEQDVRLLKGLAARIVAMLISMIRAIEPRGRDMSG
jgi:four helix bundle protein